MRGWSGSRDAARLQPVLPAAAGALHGWCRPDCMTAGGAACRDMLVACLGLSWASCHSELHRLQLLPVIWCGRCAR